MNADRNLELLAITHHLNSASSDVQGLLERLITLGEPAGIIPLLPENATTIKSLLAVQTKLIASLVEENQLIMDRVEALVTRLEK